MVDLCLLQVSENYLFRAYGNRRVHSYTEVALPRDWVREAYLRIIRFAAHEDMGSIYDACCRLRWKRRSVLTLFVEKGMIDITFMTKLVRNLRETGACCACLLLFLTRL